MRRDYLSCYTVAAIQVVQVVRCTRAHDPTSEDQIAILFEKLTLSTQQNPVPMTSFIKAQRHLYFNDLSDSFTTQLLSFRALFKDDIKQIPTVMKLAHFLVVKN